MTKVPDETIAEMRRLRSEGKSLREISEKTGYAHTTIKRRTDPNYYHLGKVSKIVGKASRKHLQIDADAQRLMANIPEDTRNLTQRFCGDPLPGRSALCKLRNT